MAPSRKTWDDWFPTLVRYAGVGIIVMFAVGSAVGLELPEAVLIAGSGMILYKEVHNAARNGGSQGNGNGGKNGHS